MNSQISKKIIPYHIETSRPICPANQCTGFYMVGTSVMKELRCLISRGWRSVVGVLTYIVPF